MRGLRHRRGRRASHRRRSGSPMPASRSREPLFLSPLDQRSIVIDRNGGVLATLYGEQNRAPVPLAEIPEHVRDAIIVVEDEDFYSHEGVNLRATVRALFENVSSGGIEQGGSTITMQVVKNSVLTNERTLERKTREAILALRLEEELTKDQILERYLNTAYFGNGAYGVQAAAETYWGVNVGDLDWGQAALLAALIRNPNGYNPLRFPEQAAERRQPRPRPAGRDRPPHRRRGRRLLVPAAAHPAAPHHPAARRLLRRGGQAAAPRRPELRHRRHARGAVQRGVLRRPAHHHHVRPVDAAAGAAGPRRRAARRPPRGVLLQPAAARKCKAPPSSSPPRSPPARFARSSAAPATTTIASTSPPRACARPARR